MKTETYKGRKLRVTRDRRTLQVNTFVNGVSRGSWIGTEDGELNSLRRTIDVVDSEPINGNRWTAEWYVPGTFGVCDNGHPRTIGAECQHSFCAR